MPVPRIICALVASFVLVLGLVPTANAARDVSGTRALIKSIALEERVDPRVLDSIIHNESGYDNSIKGAAGEVGMAQIMPFWARKFGLTLQQLRSPRHNIRSAARIILLCQAQWKPSYRMLGQVHPVLKERLGGTFSKEIFTAGCYNYGRLAYKLKKTPPERWPVLRIPKGNIRYMSRFQKTWRRAIGLRGSPRAVSASSGEPSLLDLMRARESEQRQAQPTARANRAPTVDNGWVRMVEGHGIQVRNPDNAWGRRWAMDILGVCAARVHRQHGQSIGPMVVGDWSHRGGGPMPGHRSHQKGVDVDISYYATRVAWTRRFHSPPPSELVLRPQLALLKCLADSGRVVYIFSDTPLIARLRQQAQRQWPPEVVERVFAPVRHWPNHANHLHVRFGR